MTTRKIALPLALAGSLATAVLAVAQQPTPTPLTVKTTATADKVKGTKKKPKPIGVSYQTDTATSDGSRQEGLSTVNNAWGGVVSNGKFFPTCTVDDIDAAQSDAGCPKGSLVGEGKLTALVGPDTDFSVAGAACKKDMRIYNAGKNKAAVLLVGPAGDCAGVGYLPPFPATWEKKGGIAGGQMFVNPIPSNIGHPLPGVLGSTTSVAVTFKKQTVKVKGKKRGYLESIGCKGERSYTQVLVGDPSGQTYTTKASAGAC